jgi:hypothetical protein
MPLPTSGEIRMSQINTELGRASNTMIALDAAENNGYAIINQCSPSRPSGNNPASMSEWRGYNHGASCGSLPTIYLTISLALPQFIYKWESANACGGSTLVNVPGDVYINWTSTRYTSGGLTLEEDVQSVIPSGQSVSGIIDLPPDTTGATATVRSYYIIGADANLVMCS